MQNPYGLIPDEVMPGEPEPSNVASGQLPFEFQRVPSTWTDPLYRQ